MCRPYRPGWFFGAGYLAFRSSFSLPPTPSNHGPSALRPDCLGGLKARNLLARGEAPGNMSPSFCTALKGRYNPGLRSSFSLPPTPSNHGPSALRPDCLGGLKARNLIARGEAPGNMSPSFCTALKGRHNPGLRSSVSLPPTPSNCGPSALRPDCLGGLKARNLIARGEAPGNLSPLFCTSL
jgi:hypothetical protein